MLLKKGAEAYLYKESWYGLSIIKKVRIPKSYRHPLLDSRLRMARTIHEAKLLTEARSLGISTPIVFYIDIPNTTIYMEFIEGIRVKELLNNAEVDPSSICRRIGQIMGILHQNNIIHGDLTTSNLIFEAKTKKIFLIDFGLTEYSTTLESRGVDLHLVYRVLQSTHFEILQPCFNAILIGYSSIVGEPATREVLQRFREIEQRGRYH
ncbi:MAG: KEOPS complex kinase/ATPase Bud32 [Candidatus Helarchaeota archaeon]